MPVKILTAIFSLLFTLHVNAATTIAQIDIRHLDTTEAIGEISWFVNQQKQLMGARRFHIVQAKLGTPWGQEDSLIFRTGNPTNVINLLKALKPDTYRLDVHPMKKEGGKWVKFNATRFKFTIGYSAADIIAVGTIIDQQPSTDTGSDSEQPPTTVPDTEPDTSEPEPEPESAPEPTPTPEPAPEPTPGTSSNQITITWSAPTTRSNGEPLMAAEIASYQVYHTVDDGSGNALSEQVITVPATETQLVISNPISGIHGFAIITVDTDGLESSLSEAVSYTVP